MPEEDPLPIPTKEKAVATLFIVVRCGTSAKMRSIEYIQRIPKAVEVGFVGIHV